MWNGVSRRVVGVAKIAASFRYTTRVDYISRALQENKGENCKRLLSDRGGREAIFATSLWVPVALRCQSQLLFLLPSRRDNGGKMFSTCGDPLRGVGSITGALICVGIVRINGSYCRGGCLFHSCWFVFLLQVSFLVTVCDPIVLFFLGKSFF